jgi:hypothetical protein
MGGCCGVKLPKVSIPSVKDVTNAISTSVSDVGNSVANGLNNIPLPSIPNIPSVSLPSIEDLTQSISTNLSNLGNSINDVLVDIPSNIVSAVTKGADDIIDNTSVSINNIANSATHMVEDTTAWISDYVTKPLSSIDTIAFSLASPMVGSLASIISGGSQLLSIGNDSSASVPIVSSFLKSDDMNKIRKQKLDTWRDEINASSQKWWGVNWYDTSDNFPLPILMFYDTKGNGIWENKAVYTARTIAITKGAWNFKEPSYILRYTQSADTTDPSNIQWSLSSALNYTPETLQEYITNYLKSSVLQPVNDITSGIKDKVTGYIASTVDNNNNNQNNNQLDVGNNDGNATNDLHSMYEATGMPQLIDETANDLNQFINNNLGFKNSTKDDVKIGLYATLGLVTLLIIRK